MTRTDPTFYQRRIAERTSDVDPRHIEAWMRLSHPTLDGLSRSEFLAAMYEALGQVQDAARVWAVRHRFPLTAPGVQARFLDTMTPALVAREGRQRACR